MTASRSCGWPTGPTHLDIAAADLGITPRTVLRRLNAYRDGGLGALKPRRARGYAPAIPAPMAEGIRRRVIDGPAERGLDRANWTHAELADHLSKTQGISASRSAMRRFCRQHGIEPYRPTYRHLRGDPVKQAEAAEELADLRTRAEAGELVRLSQDEARFPMVPTLGATHNRLLESLGDWKRSLRASPCDFQMVRGRIRNLVAGCYTRPANQKASAGL